MPKLAYLHAIELTNHSLLIEWSLLYSGGSPVVSFEIHVILQSKRVRRQSADLIYHVDVQTGHVLTRSLERSQTYIVMATMFTNIGSTEDFTYGWLV